MKVEQQRVGTVDVFTPSAAMVDQDGEVFIELLHKRLTSPNPRVVVAMHEVGFMDSAALEGLVAATEQLSQSAAALKLVAVTPTCREIFGLTGLSGRFRFRRPVFVFRICTFFIAVFRVFIKPL